MQMTGNETVDQLIDFQPVAINIPHAWFKTIVNTKGKPNMNAIIILSEIVYWYRPTVMKDETTGEFIGYKKKFKADLLQKNRSGFAKTFGLSKDQVYTALKLLEELGVIKSVLRNVQYSDTVLNNVRYIELNVERLKDLSYPIVGKREGYRTDTIGVSYKNETNTSITSTSITSTKKNIVELNSTLHHQVISYLCEKTGGKFSPTAEANKKLVNGRKAEGYKFEDFKAVIDIKVAQWKGDPKMSRYLRPSTLFAPSKFEGYLNEAPATRKVANTPLYAEKSTINEEEMMKELGF